MGTVAILSLTSALVFAAKTAPAPQPPRKPGAPTAVHAGRPSAAGLSSPQSTRLSVTATTERIPLPGLRGPIDLTVDALSRRIVLRPSRKDDARALAGKIVGHVGLLCPRVEVKGDTVELGCRGRRFEAQVTPEGKLSYLDINELRGLPWRQGLDAPPTYHYDPWRVGLGQSCPGRNEAVQGECAMKQGMALEAAKHFRAAFDTNNRSMASLRMGDLAVSIGDPLTAAGWYRRAGAYGPFGRVAATRLCELDGSCLGTTDEVVRLFDANGLPEPLRAEMTMRAARAEAYAGRLPSAVHIIAKSTRGHGTATVCRESGDSVCRRILAEAMRAAKQTLAGTDTRPAGTSPKPLLSPAGGLPPLDDEERAYLEELLETYLATPSWEKGPLAVEMAQAAAPLAARLGAPGFGGNLLAALAPEVPDAQLSDHLLLAAETFLEGQNWPRARLVAEYAESRLGDNAKNNRGGGTVKSKAGSKFGSEGRGIAGYTGLKGPRWAAVLRTLAARMDDEDVTPAIREAIEKEMDATMEELKSARGVLDRAEAVLTSAQAAKEAAKAAAKEAAKAAAKEAGKEAGKASGGKDQAKGEGKTVAAAGADKDER